MNIDVSVKNKIATLIDPDIYGVCHNDDYIVHFNFDSEWDEFTTKTMRINYDGHTSSIIFSGDECALPPITEPGSVEIGVFAGDLRTTTPATMPFIKSIISAAGPEPDPTPEVYNQILELLNGFSATASKLGHTTTITITDPEGTTVAEIHDGTSIESITYTGKDSEGGNVYEVLMSDGVKFPFTAPKGEKGEKGDNGKDAVTENGTVVSGNADFAEVAEWADGNPNNEDRTGYFVCANVPVDGIVMKKATSLDDVKGVTILAPAFAGNYTEDKLDSTGNLLPKYSYVAVIGFVPVIDNGTCEVGGRCMPDDNGCAIPSSNNMGYQVVNRIDENRVLIIIEPNGDMVQRITTEVNQVQDDIKAVVETTATKADISYVDNLFANALKGSASGEGFVTVKDVSPVPHNILVKVKEVKYEAITVLDGYFPNQGDYSCWYDFECGASSFTFKTKTKMPCDVGFDFVTDQDTSDGGTAEERFGISEDCYWHVSYNNNTLYFSFYRDAEATDLIDERTIRWHIPDCKIVCINYCSTENCEVLITQYFPVFVDGVDKTINVCGKNLFDKTAPQYSGIYVDALNGEDFVVTIKGNNQYYVSANFVIPNGDALVGKTLTVCGEWEASGTNEGGLRVLWTKATNPTLALGNGGAFATISGRPSTKNVPEKPDGAGELCLFIYGNTTGTAAVGDTVTYKNIQVEIGETATEYEEYFATEYTANADGVVEGVKSRYPSMTFFTDTEGVSISAEYNRDINKAFAELSAAVISLGGNV